MFSRYLRVALCGAVATLTSVGPTLSHEIVGNRFFPATLTIDDPGVNDELAFPTVSISKTGDDPSFKQLDVSAEFAKRITDDFAISVAPTWSRLYAPGGPTMNGASGFQNLATLFKYRLFKNPEHEFVMSAGLEIEWGRTGAQGVGAEPFNVYTPTLFFWQRIRRSPHQIELGAAIRDNRPSRVFDPSLQTDGYFRSRHWRR